MALILASEMQRTIGNMEVTQALSIISMINCKKEKVTWRRKSGDVLVVWFPAGTIPQSNSMMGEKGL